MHAVHVRCTCKGDDTDIHILLPHDQDDMQIDMPASSATMFECFSRVRIAHSWLTAHLNHNVTRPHGSLSTPVLQQRPPPLDLLWRSHIFAWTSCPGHR